MCPNVFAYCRISPSHSRGTSQQLQLEDLFTNWLELAILWHFFSLQDWFCKNQISIFFSPTLIICGTLGGQMFSVEYCNCYSGAVSLANSKLVGSKICSQTGRCSESEIANDHIVPVLLLSWTNLCHLRFTRKMWFSSHWEQSVCWSFFFSRYHEGPVWNVGAFFWISFWNSLNVAWILAKQFFLAYEVDVYSFMSTCASVHELF